MKLGKKLKWCITVKLGLAKIPGLHLRMVGYAHLVRGAPVAISGAASKISGRRADVLLLPNHARMTSQ